LSTSCSCPATCNSLEASYITHVLEAAHTSQCVSHHNRNIISVDSHKPQTLCLQSCVHVFYPRLPLGRAGLSVEQVGHPIVQASLLSPRPLQTNHILAIANRSSIVVIIKMIVHPIPYDHIVILLVQVAVVFHPCCPLSDTFDSTHVQPCAY